MNAGREAEFSKIRQRADGMRVLHLYCHDCCGFKPVLKGTRFDAGESMKCPSCGGVNTWCEVLPSKAVGAKGAV